ncbi:reprolysin-like metallopeptidase [Catenovulum adriaticum]|uniref:M12 family metallo-peptidase n=1 Tax=Catenovulum adriaticum TaxID=2984846 RepID=A0ABY7ALX5_9ALTE|nr:zinc-dependent metalloprotease family protein [Catenovulum sp. TS8]WAJ69732.1 M12 family metallo-peptidase [Catenovulum sp. TS8]
MKLFSLLFGALLSYSSYAQNTNWQPITPQLISNANLTSSVLLHDNAILIKSLNTRFKNDLKQIAKTGIKYELSLPQHNDKQLIYIVQYSPIMANELAAKHADILTFKGHKKGDKSQRGRFDLGPNGFYASYQIDQVRYYLDEHTSDNLFELYPYQNKAQVNETILNYAKPQLSRKGSLDIGQRELTTYRLAVATTGEYANYFINRQQNVLNAIVTTINRVNDIFARDLAIRLELVANNDELIYTNPNEDPFTNSDSEADLNSTQTTVDNIIGSNNYDIGHLFTTNPGGIAQVGSICFNGFKAQGTSGSPNPTGDGFNIDLVSHEIGHQFGATHSFNATSGFCGDSRSSNNAYELGSGVTIMGYAGICDDENIANRTMAVFHSKNIEQIYKTINSNQTTGSCGITQAANNQAPVADAGKNYTIAQNTPFVLTGSATDIENDTLTYSWEQIDLGDSTSAPSDWANNGNGPLFRNWLPDTSPQRFFPRIDDLANNRNTPAELLPTTNRTMLFKLAVRDQQGGIGTDDTQITVDANVGPLTVTSPTNNSLFSGQENININWEVNQTQTLCPQVNILLSDDNAQTFKYTLANAVENTGSAQITLPNIDTLLAKIMVICNDNIFFNLSPGNFEIIPVSNTAPSAQNDAFTLNTSNNDTLILDVLNNDTDADNDILLITQTNYQGNGSVIINDNQITYMPATNFTGTETFSYTISDGQITDNANISVQVTATTANPELEIDMKKGGVLYKSSICLIFLLNFVRFRKKLKNKQTRVT